jgi:hypothetical protein
MKITKEWISFEYGMWEGTWSSSDGRQLYINAECTEPEWEDNIVGDQCTSVHLIESTSEDMKLLYRVEQYDEDGQDESRVDLDLLKAVLKEAEGEENEKESSICKTENECNWYL